MHVMNVTRMRHMPEGFRISAKADVSGGGLVHPGSDDQVGAPRRKSVKFWGEREGEGKSCSADVAGKAVARYSLKKPVMDVKAGCAIPRHLVVGQPKQRERAG